MPVEHRAHVLQRVVCLLDPDRARVLEILLIFLRELSKASATTLMNTHNLAIVFAPNILRSGTDNPGQVITDAKATLEIINLLLVDASIVSQRAEDSKSIATSHAAAQQAKSEKFKRTMRENYQAIRKDSTRKLEQASRKSRVSVSEFNKKMEMLSQRILDGEIDPALFDEAATKFMDPQLIAQFSGQNEPLVTGHRANRQARNANRNAAIIGGVSFAGRKSPDFSQVASEEELALILNSDVHAAHEAKGDAMEQQQFSATTSPDASQATSSPVSPRSPRPVMPRTKPTLQRATSASSHTTNVEAGQVSLGLQRNRSNQLAPSADRSQAQAAHAHGQPGGAFSLGTHRPKTAAEVAISAPVSQKLALASSQVSRGTAETKSYHRASDPTALASNASGDDSGRAAFSPRDSASPTPIDSPTQREAMSPEFSDEEDLDDIMGDLLKPHDHTMDSPQSSRTRPSYTPLSQSTGSQPDSEAATIVTLELIELMLGQTSSDLPEIVVPAEVSDALASSRSNSSLNSARSSGAASDGADEEVVEVPSNFPTTGLFSSPLIASGTRTTRDVDPSIPSMDAINEILKGN